MAFKKVFFIWLLVFFTCTGNRYSYAQGADSLLNFIAQNNSRSAVYISQNGSILAKLNENKLMPLASTVKILVAVEFAKQAGNNVLDENEYVPLNELDRYYLPGTDGGSHTTWLGFEAGSKHIKRDSIQLINIARGMIMFSSNANTEYLLDRLGMDNVKSNTKLFGLTQHTAIFPLVSSLFLYQNPNKEKEGKILRGISDLTEEQYCKTIYEIHKALKYDTVLKKKFWLQDLSMKMQKLWSDRLPASTTKEYVQLCSVLNRRKYLNSESYDVVAEVLESIMENPLNKKIYKHFGLKNGSTASVLTEAFYATMQNGDEIEAAYFFNGLTLQENEKLQGWLNDFRIGITQDKNFQKKISVTLK